MSRLEDLQPNAAVRGILLESQVPGTGKLRFIEVKGRVTGADTITVTKNEILYSLNKPDDFILAIVEFLDGDSRRCALLRGTDSMYEPGPLENHSYREMESLSRQPSFIGKAPIG